MKKWDFTLGVDVSKLTLDIHCWELNIHIQVANGSAGYKQFLKWCKEVKINLSSCFIAMEYTGGYEYKFIQFCEAKNLSYCRVPGLSIKNSLGIVRGKNDKADARRIAQYASEKHEHMKAAGPINTAIVQLRQYLSFRKRLVRESAGYKASLTERKAMYKLDKNDIIAQVSAKKIADNGKLITKIEREIRSLIQSDQKLLMNFKIISSIKGIGEINAWMTLAFTENFSCFKSPRSYAVYVGVVPFEHTSGTSIKGRKKVSQLANKELKQELNQAAKSAMTWNKDIKAYADRRLKEKPYKVVLNNVKFKLILRMF
ncbi:MAG: family transposase [Ferruginibacter sp.]|nr:family transposase [Ferruginibacter sp.]